MTDGDDYIFICFLSTGLSYCSEVSAFPSHPHFLDHFLEPPISGELQMWGKKSAGTNQPRGYPAVWLPSSTVAFFRHSSHLSIPGLCKGGFSSPSSSGWFFLPTDQINTNFWTTVAPPLLVYSFSLGWGGEFMPMLAGPIAYLPRQL